MKKFFCFFITCIMLLTAVGTMRCVAVDEIAPQETKIRFDMNGDGILNVFDLVRAKYERNLEACYYLEDFLHAREIRDMYPLTIDLDDLVVSPWNKSYLEDLMNSASDISLDFMKSNSDSTLTVNQITVNTNNGIYCIRGTIVKTDLPVLAISADYEVLWHDTMVKEGNSYEVGIVKPNDSQFQLVVTEINTDNDPTIINLDKLVVSPLNRSYLENLLNSASDISLDSMKINDDSILTVNQITVNTNNGIYCIRGTIARKFPVVAMTADYLIWNTTVVNYGKKYQVAVIQPNVSQFQLAVSPNKVIIRDTQTN